MANVVCRTTSPHPNTPQYHFTPILTTMPLDPPMTSPRDFSENHSNHVLGRYGTHTAFTAIAHSDPHPLTSSEELLSPSSVLNAIRVTPPTPEKSPHSMDGNAEFSSNMPYYLGSQMESDDAFVALDSMPSYSDTTMMNSDRLTVPHEQHGLHLHPHHHMPESNMRNENDDMLESDDPRDALRPFNPFATERKPPPPLHSLSSTSWTGKQEDGGGRDATMRFDQPTIASAPSGFSDALALKRALEPDPDASAKRFMMPMTLMHGRRTRWIETEKIVLRSLNGEYGPDIHYPTNPSFEDLVQSLEDPNAPPSMKSKSAATTHHLRYYGYGFDAQAPSQLFDGAFCSPGAERLPSAMPYRSPCAASYLEEDKSFRPHRQDEKLRFPGDLYTPRWVRGEGSEREGWCSLCHEGHWYQLKTSAYWYHARFTHGINSNTGRIYDPPIRLRLSEDSFASICGLCGECNAWVTICTPRRKRTFCGWFKHAHKCHRIQSLGAIALNTVITSGPASYFTKPHFALHQHIQHPEDDEMRDSPASSTVTLMSSPRSVSSPFLQGGEAHFGGGLTGFTFVDGGSSGSGNDGNAALPHRCSWPHGTVFGGTGFPTNVKSPSKEVSFPTTPRIAPSHRGALPPSSTRTGLDHTHRRSNSDGMLLG